MYDWKLQFSKYLLEQGKEYFDAGRVVDLQESDNVCTAGVLEKMRYDVRLVQRKEKEGYLMTCHCPKARSGAKCKHMAAVLYALEDRKMKQDSDTHQMTLDELLAEDGAVNARKEALQATGDAGSRKNEEATQKAAMQGKLEREEQLVQEIPAQTISEHEIASHTLPEQKEGSDTEYIVLNRQEEAGEQEKNPHRAKNYESLSEYQYFDFDAIKKSMHLTEQQVRKSEELLDKKLVSITGTDSGFGDESSNMLVEVVGEGQQGRNTFPLQLVFDRKSVLYAECSCSACRQHYYYRYYRREYCTYLAAFAELVKEQLQGKNIGDATDKTAARLMYAFSERRANHIVSDTLGKSESLTLLPRLCKRNGELSVSFKVGEKKLFVVKDLFKFYSDVQESRNGTYGSSTKINHRIDNFTEEGKGWIEFIGQIVKEEQNFARRLIEAEVYSKRAVAKNGELALFGWRLDELYRLLGSSGIEYENRDVEKKEKRQLYSREQNPKISMTIRKNKLSSRHAFHGVEVDCRMPELYEGSSTLYYIQGDGLCRMQEEFAGRIRTLADFCSNGSMSFLVGRNHLAQFYYNVLPQLEGVVDVMEENAEEIASYLPPRAQFVFFLDAEEHNMSCRIRVRYGEQEFSLLEESDETELFRDGMREDEILFRARQWFPYYDSQRQELNCGQDEELMYQVLERGVEALLALGEVQCTRRFSGMNVGRRMRVSVGVSVSRDLLNLDVATQDVPPEELLEILKSYRAKKKYHRLKSGDFLSLEDDSLATLEEMLETLRLSPRELLKGNVKLPLYRALYLDKLLEKNEEIYSNRDSHFREMVKNFKTVKDADFEVPDSLRGIMRGYQRLGYRWLRLLEEYHLGGILADDMGLGKTLQVIAVLLAAKKEGKNVTSLVVTPASLVYNWGEELKRFAPELSCCFITGNQEERAQKLEQYRFFDVIVTSYDLLKRDIANYEDKEFYYQVIDEAQYIKNHTTAAAKAVKGIKSRTRYALTGTPIENRLSELWSIFDYLIPGYLYGYEVFKNDFETPIVRNEEQAALERLQRMTGPFILRRLKENVLRDLPEKLEENRYVKFDDEQQRIYDAQVIRMKQKIVTQDAEEFKKSKLQILAELMRLRQICCDPGLCFENYKGESAKLDACVELMQSAVEGGHKILLFSQFTSMLELLAARLAEEKLSYYTITGDTPKEKRLQLVKAFNEDDTKVFLISLKAGGVGLNLVGADVVIHYDPWWNVAVQNQATDRAHRIGQTKKVVVYRLIAKGTIEEKIQQLQESKKALSDQIIQGDVGQLGAMTREDFLSLLE